MQQLCSQLGLPEESIRSGDDIIGMIEADMLANATSEGDQASKRRPFLVFAHMGDYLDRFDNMNRLNALCKNERLWLHVEGESIVLLGVKKPPAEVQPIVHADSLLINAADLCPGENVNSFVAFYRRDAPAWAIVEKLGVSTKRMQLSLWLQMQMLGRSNIVNGISKAHHLVQLMATRLKEVPFVQFLADPHPAQVQIALRYVASSLPFVSRQEMSAESSSSPVTLQPPSSSTPRKSASPLTPRASDADAAVQQASPFLNQINQRILTEVVQAINAQDPNHAISLELSLINVSESEDVASSSSTAPFRSLMRFAPLTSRSLWQLSDAQVTAFCDNFIRQASLINSCILHRPILPRACERLARASILPVTSRPFDLLGLGAIRYRPAIVADLASGGLTEGDKTADLVRVPFSFPF